MRLSRQQQQQQRRQRRRQHPAVSDATPLHPGGAAKKLDDSDARRQQQAHKIPQAEDIAHDCNDCHDHQHQHQQQQQQQEKSPATPADLQCGADSDEFSTLDMKGYAVDIEYRDRSEGGRQFSFAMLFRFMGPGFLVSIALMDPGNLEGDLQVAAAAGYKLLWLLLLSHIICFGVQTLASRLGVITSFHLAQHIKKQYPRPLSTFFWLMAELAIIGADIQEVIGTAIAIQLFIPSMPLWGGVLITAADSFVFLSVQQFGARITEFTFGTIIAVMATAFWVEMFMVKPDAKDVVKGIFIPQIPANAAIQAVGMIGAIVMPHNLYLHSALVQSRRIDRRPEFRIAAIKQANFYFLFETGLAILFSFLINLAVIVSFVEAFYQLDMAGISYVPSLQDGGRALQNVLGKAGRYVFAVGLLAAGQSSTMAGTLAGQYVTEGFWRIPLKRWQRIAITRCISLIPATVVSVLAAKNLDLLGEIINVVQTVQLPFTLAPLFKLLACTSVVGHFASSRLERVACAVLVVAVYAINVYTLASEVSSGHLALRVVTYILLVAYGVAILYIYMRPLHTSTGSWVDGDGCPPALRRLFGKGAHHQQQ
ncbi:hypothetical protein EV182_001335 [Spiromyces aspiralis]|uniref:Uncharacterized protein n=1 Tax=Spiromyces aspiralis TaxID=68401 RepID=A0ACC1HID2_9FUNG|nr:hypothetical protein EV182_001335 [Spiromyces aspiralis]